MQEKQESQRVSATFGTDFRFVLNTWLYVRMQWYSRRSFLCVFPEKICQTSGHAA